MGLGEAHHRKDKKMQEAELTTPAWIIATGDQFGLNLQPLMRDEVSVGQNAKSSLREQERGLAEESTSPRHLLEPLIGVEPTT